VPSRIAEPDGSEILKMQSQDFENALSQHFGRIRRLCLRRTISR